MKHKTKKFIYNIVVILLLITGISWVFSRLIHLGRVEYTDNAQIRQLIVPVNSGYKGLSIKSVSTNTAPSVKEFVCLFLFHLFSGTGKYPTVGTGHDLCHLFCQMGIYALADHRVAGECDVADRRIVPHLPYPE
jgi:hypothetical protein